MEIKKAEELWEIHDITGIYPSEVTAEEAFQDEKHKKLNPGYVKDILNEDGCSFEHYYKLDTYQDSDFENTKFKLEIEKVRALRSIKGWITFWSVLSILALVLVIISQFL